MSDIHRTGARFDVVCKRCKARFDVIRNWGGGIRREGGYKCMNESNPAKCSCGSTQLEVF